VASLAAARAGAQTGPDTTGQSGAPQAISWSVEAGYETFWLRTIGRTTPRADASPASWDGDGPSLAVRYDRATPKRLHRFSLSFASAGHFVYDAIVRTFPRSPDDHVVRVGGQYEYRRYPFRNLWIGGLDVGVGVQGLGEYMSSTRHVDPSIEIGKSEIRLGTAIVAASRFHRWQKLDVEVAWVNGIVLNRTHGDHSEDAQAAYVQWGGGWLTDLALVATVPVSRRAGIQASFLRSTQGFYASHDQYASGHSRFLVGMTYGR